MGGGGWYVWKEGGRIRSRADRDRIIVGISPRFQASIFLSCGERGRKRMGWEIKTI